MFHLLKYKKKVFFFFEKISEIFYEWTVLGKKSKKFEGWGWKVHQVTIKYATSARV